MTLNERKQLTNYIKGLVRESISGEMPAWYKKYYGDEDFDEDEFEDDYEDETTDATNEFWEEMGKEQPGRTFEGPDVTATDDVDIIDDEDDEIAGINELRKMTESMARNAVLKVLSEAKKKSKSKKKANMGKTIATKLNSDGVNAAHYYYKLYGVENGTDAEKASARSKGYKKAKGKKNDSGVPYKFTSKEANSLNSMLTDK